MFNYVLTQLENQLKLQSVNCSEEQMIYIFLLKVHKNNKITLFETKT